MEHATITLQGCLTHTVRLPNHSEITFVKGRPYRTSDRAIIEYAKGRPVFGVTLNVIQQAPMRPIERANTSPVVMTQRTGAGKFIKKSPVGKVVAPGSAEGSSE